MQDKKKKQTNKKNVYLVYSFGAVEFNNILEGFILSNYCIIFIFFVK